MDDNIQNVSYKSPTQPIIHPSELLHYVQVNQQNSIIAWLCGFAAMIGLISGSFIKEYPIRFTVHTLSTLVAIGGFISYKASTTAERTRQDIQDISTQQFANRVYAAMEPSATFDVQLNEADWEPQFISLDTLMNQPSGIFSRHLLLDGVIGSGKSSLLNYLLMVANGQKLIITPKKRDNEFIDIPCIGITVDTNGKRQSFDFNAIAQGINALASETRRRYSLPTVEMDTLPTLWVGVDELPVIATNLPNELQTLAITSTESRDARVRFCFVVTDDSVKTLKLEGQGKLRENWAYIRIGTRAMEHCKKLIKDGVLPPTAMSVLISQTTPCMYEDSFVDVPRDLWSVKPPLSEVTIRDYFGKSQYQAVTSSNEDDSYALTESVNSYWDSWKLLVDYPTESDLQKAVVLARQNNVPNYRIVREIFKVTGRRLTERPELKNLALQYIEILCSDVMD